MLGEHDCGLFLADWVKRVTGRDPAAPVRGRYHDEKSLMALTGPLGLPRLFDRLLRDGGMLRTRDPQFGDVAMVTVAGMRPRGAIKTEGYVLVGEEGVSGARGVLRVIMAWTFP